MTLGSQEHYDVMASFEKHLATTYHRGRMDKEDKSMWRKQIFYQDGNINSLFQLYRAGYSNARCVYLQGGPNT